jgi:hypothetical protein
LINEFLQLSGNLPPTIRIPSLVTSHSFVLSFFSFFLNYRKGWTLSAVSVGSFVSGGQSHVCGTDYFAARTKIFNQAYGDV